MGKKSDALQRELLDVYRRLAELQGMKWTDGKFVINQDAEIKRLRDALKEIRNTALSHGEKEIANFIYDVLKDQP
jgi:hypothetical protein